MKEQLLLRRLMFLKRKREEPLILHSDGLKYRYSEGLRQVRGIRDPSLILHSPLTHFIFLQNKREKCHIFLQYLGNKLANRDFF
jgi:hypothetical protein